MSRTPPVRDLLGSTRGEILSLLCSSSRTIGELTKVLGLTANAVRGHLAVLERDGMVRHTLFRGGVGKPAHLYEATPGGRGLLSRAYQPALGAMLDVLADQLPGEELESTLRDAGRRLAQPHQPVGGALGTRVAAAVGVLEELGSVAHVEPSEAADTFLICGQCCPLADLVAEHPEVCLMVESMLARIIDAPVRERCHRESVPGCRFLVGSEAGS